MLLSRSILLALLYRGDNKSWGMVIVAVQWWDWRRSLPDFSRESGVWQFLDMATKLPWNLSAGLIFGATGTARRAPSI